jgi:hypothetical protein
MVAKRPSREIRAKSRQILIEASERVDVITRQKQKSTDADAQQKFGLQNKARASF